MTPTRSIASTLATRLVREFRLHGPFYGAWLCWFGFFILLVRSTLGGPDGNRYMAYLRSIVFDRDLLLMNELEHFGQHVIVTTTGYSAQIANVGVIPFWLPFYLMGVLAHAVGGFLGSGLGSDYALWLDFGDWFYGLLALIVMYRWARTRFTRLVALASTLAVAFGSSFYYYMTALAPSYHMVSALLCAIYLYLWDTTRKGRTAIQWLALGLLLGILASIAQYQVLLGVFLLFDWCLALAGTVLERRGPRARPAIRTLPSGALLVIPGVIVPLVPQFIAWAIVFGNPFFNPYTAEADWSAAHFFDIFVSSYHGLFFTAPLLLIAVLGWLASPRVDRALAIGSFAVLLGIAYSSATRIGWWAGVSFGARYFIVLTPLFILGLARLLEHSLALPRVGKAAVAALSAAAILCGLWTFGYYLQAASGMTSFSEYHPAGQWLADQAAILRDPGPVLAQYWLAPRSPALLANVAGFALYSLVLGRLAEGWIRAGRISTRRGWIVALGLMPAGFALLLMSTIAPGAQHRQELAASGYYEKNAARGQLDYEQFSNEYVESARYHAARAQADAERHDIERALALWPGKARSLVSDAETANFRPLHLRFGDQIELLGYQLVGDTAPPSAPAMIPCAVPPAPCAATLRLLWRASSRLPADYDTAILLLNTTGTELARTPDTRGVFPFPSTWWPAGIMLSDEHVLDLKASPAPELLHAKVQVFDGAAGRRLPALDANGAANDGSIGELKRSAPPADLTPARAMLGDAIALVNAGAMTWSNGIAELPLTWRAETTMTQDYTVFVHLLDAQNRIVAQNDSMPRGGTYPTHAWSSGETVVDVHRIPASQATVASVAHIEIGMYNASDGRRLPIAGGGDAIILNP